MDLNADFSKRVSVHAAEMPWVASPMAGVSRRMLDRIGDEVARATSIVRYDPGSHFSAHVHTGGEEFLVLEGVFQDEHGDYPVGTYVRNPPQSRHTPGSEPGCVILVKLWQFDLEDRCEVRIEAAHERSIEQALGVTRVPLHTDPREDVGIETWAPGCERHLGNDGGLEVFVIEGGFDESGEGFARHSWLRLPHGEPLTARAGPNGAKVWIKAGNLRYAHAPELPSR